MELTGSSVQPKDHLSPTYFMCRWLSSDQMKNILILLSCHHNLEFNKIKLQGDYDYTILLRLEETYSQMLNRILDFLIFFSKINLKGIFEIISH